MSIFRGRNYPKGISQSAERNIVNAGTPNTGVTAEEYGDGYNHVTVLTVSQADALTLADNTDIADGYLLYTFPAGVIIVDATYMSMAITAASPQLVNDTPIVGIGTVIGTGAVNDLVGTGTFEDLLIGQSANDCTGTAEVACLAPTAANSFVILSGAAHTVHFNAAATWSNDTSTDLSADIAGTVVLKWTFLA